VQICQWNYKKFIIFSGHVTVKEVPFFHVIDVSDFVLFLMEVGALDPYQQQVKIGIDDGQGNDIKQYYFYNQKTFCKFSKKKTLCIKLDFLPSSYCLLKMIY